MRARFTIFLTLTLIFALVSSTVLQNRTNARVETKSNQVKPQVKRKPIQPDLPGTVSGATDPDAIPDTIAYELFMRSIGDYQSENAFKDLGLSEDQIENFLSYVRTFETVIGALDHAARYVKRTRRATEKLAQFQKQKEEFLDRELNHFLPGNFGTERANKIRSAINDRVKPKTKKLPANSAKRNEVNDSDSKAIATSRSQRSARHASAPMPSGGVYIYTNAWRDGENVMAPVRFPLTILTTISIS